MIEGMRSAAEDLPQWRIADDYLTAPQAAAYACMPLADFLPAARRCGVVSFHLYRKADIQAAMEQTRPGLKLIETSTACASPARCTRS
jgi:hypothetical protein